MCVLLPGPLTAKRRLRLSSQYLRCQTAKKVLHTLSKINAPCEGRRSVDGGSGGVTSVAISEVAEVLTDSCSWYSTESAICESSERGRRLSRMSIVPTRAAGGVLKRMARLSRVRLRRVGPHDVALHCAKHGGSMTGFALSDVAAHLWQGVSVSE